MLAAARSDSARRRFELQSSGVITWAIAFTAIAAAVFLTSSNVSAEDAADHVPATAYRRIFVPADNLPTWPRGNDKFLPIESHDFDAWVAEANRPAGTARIVDAEYTGRLEGRQLASGHARWKIQLADNRPAFLPLGNMSLITGAANWRGDVEQPARLGWWARSSGEPPVRGLQVSRSGDLTFEWHSAQAKSTADDLDFSLQLPSAVKTRLTLDLPATMIPALSGSVLIESQELPATEPTNGVNAGPQVNSTEQWRRWTWAVGASNTHQLHIAVAPGDRPTSPPTVTVRKDIRYHVTNQGLDFETRLQLDPGNAELPQLNLSFTASPKIISVTANDQEVPWHLTGAAQGGGTQLVIEPPKPLSGSETTIVVQAWDETVSKQSWTLPSVQVNNTFWSSGSIELAIDDDLELEEVVPTGCAQTVIRREESATGNTTTILISVIFALSQSRRSNCPAVAFGPRADWHVARGWRPDDQRPGSHAA